MADATGVPGDPPTGAPDLRSLVDRVFAALEARDSAAMLRLCADDAVIIDPHYPTPRMVGKAAIADGLRWAFGMLRSLSFSVLHFYPSGDGRGAAVEVATAHVPRAGRPLQLTQVFIIEARDGLLTRLQAYEPYGPSGAGGLLLRASHLAHRASSRRHSRG